MSVTREHGCRARAHSCVRAAAGGAMLRTVCGREAAPKLRAVGEAKLEVPRAAAVIWDCRKARSSYQRGHGRLVAGAQV